MTTSKLGSICLMALILSGCSGSNNRNRVSGTVTFAGKPIPSGQIFFDPDPARGGQGVQGYADILDGRYDTALSNRGAPIGPVIVRIHGRGTEKNVHFPLGIPIMKWETPAEITAGSQVKDFDAPASAAVRPPPTAD